MASYRIDSESGNEYRATIETDDGQLHFHHIGAKSRAEAEEIMAGRALAFQAELDAASQPVAEPVAAPAPAPVWVEVGKLVAGRVVMPDAKEIAAKEARRAGIVAEPVEQPVEIAPDVPVKPGR